MKKLLSILLLLSLLFSMVACQKDEPDVPTPQEPVNVGYVPYKLYYYATLSSYDDFPTTAEKNAGRQENLFNEYCVFGELKGLGTLLTKDVWICEGCLSTINKSSFDH